MFAAGGFGRFAGAPCPWWSVGRRCNGRMKRRWRVVLLRAKDEILGTVEAPDVEAAKAAAAVQFDLDEVRRPRMGRAMGG